MYKVSEKKLEELLCEGTRLVDKLSNYRGLNKEDITHFGNALIEVQTEVHRQGKPQGMDIFGDQRVRI